MVVGIPRVLIANDLATGQPSLKTKFLSFLMDIGELIGEQLWKREPAVVSCSALKRSYRDRLRRGNKGLLFIYLKGSFDLIWPRIRDRQEHYMKSGMLQSQFDSLEEPVESESDVITVPIDQPLEAIVAEILSLIKRDNISCSEQNS